jgi:hypothetical protein
VDAGAAEVAEASAPLEAAAVWAAWEVWKVLRTFCGDAMTFAETFRDRRRLDSLTAREKLNRTKLDEFF